MNIITPIAAKTKAEENTKVSEATISLLNDKIVAALENGSQTVTFDLSDLQSLKETRGLVKGLEEKGYKVKAVSDQRDGSYLHIAIP